MSVILAKGIELRPYGKAFIVFGENTKNYKDDLKKLGGSWKPLRMADAPAEKAWIFPPKRKDEIEKFFALLQTPVQM